MEVKQGALVFFNGLLVHCGELILERGSFRHAPADQYIARSLADWLDVHGPQMAFDGSEQYYRLPESA